MNDPFAPYLIASPVLVVVSGPSAVGKDTVLSRMRALGLPFYFVVTVTTRPKRAHEVEGRDYHFLSDEEYDRLLAANEFLEHATVYGAHRYGVLKAPIREALAAGRDVILRIDPIKGATTIRRLVPNAVFIFLVPPSLQELERRLRERAGEINFEERRRTALEEFAQIKHFQYVVVNDRVEAAVEKICAIITAEKCRVGRRPIQL